MSGRGYGHQHRVLRAQLQLVVDAGKAKCWRCGDEVPAGSHWHLGHDDDDRTIYRGIEHPECNLSAAGVKARTRDRLRIQRRPRRAIRARQRDCLICGTGFKASYPDQRTCSRACGWELRRREALPRTDIKRVKPERTPRACPHCGAMHTARSKYCTPECARQAKLLADRQYRAAHPLVPTGPYVPPMYETQCIDCRQSFIYPYYSNARDRCDDCRRQRVNRQKHPERGAAPQGVDSHR